MKLNSTPWKKFTLNSLGTGGKAAGDLGGNRRLTQTDTDGSEYRSKAHVEGFWGRK